MITTHAPVSSLAVALALAAGGCRPADEPGLPSPAATAPAAAALPDATSAGRAAPPPAAPAAASDDPLVATFAGFTAPKPASWRWYPPESSMRAANYVVPAASGEEQAHVVVFQGIGGGVEMNIERWIGQFRAPDAGPVIPEISTIDVEGMSVTLVELMGSYRGMGQTGFSPDQLFLSAIVESPGGDLQIRLVGSRETVEAQRDSFMAMIRGLRPSGGS